MTTEREERMLNLDFEPFDEPERYDLEETPAYRFELDRREFLAVLGAGLIVSTTLGGALAQQRQGRGGSSIDDRLHIGVDGEITVLTGKVEVGQGSRTQIAMAAAEELRVSLEAVRVVMADSAVTPDDGGTSGSRTTPSTVPRVRRACRAARQVLEQAAAKRWNVSASSLDSGDGQIRVRGEDRSATYGEIVSKQLKDGLDGDPGSDIEVTAVSEWKILGSNPPRRGGEAIVTGKHRYPSDIQRPGMLHGKVLRPPSYDATLETVDLAPARALDGVVAVHDGDFVGLAAPTSHRARAALRTIAAGTRWREDPQQTSHLSSEALHDHLVSSASDEEGRRSRRRRRGGPRERGDVEAAFKDAETTQRQMYRIAYIQHAPMETRAAVAEWSEGKLTVWTGTQNPGRVREQVAEAFGLDRDRVRVIVPDTGGAFGGKHTGEVAIEAARLAREAARPVSLQWTREEEFMWAYFRPAGVIEVAGALDAQGRITAFEQTNYNSGSSAIGSPYAIENTRTRYRRSDAPLREGSYRALASTANVFARECMMDELATAASVDPLEFRLRHLSNERLRDVLKGATERFGWQRRAQEIADSPSPRKRGIGLSCGVEKGSYTAACAEVEFDRESGTYRVVEVCQAFECGAIHNPVNLRAQVEGCLLQGLGAVLREAIRFDRGRIRNDRFSRYHVPRFADVPQLDIVLLDRPDLPSVGGSETPIVAVAPAVGNALFSASGVRLRSLPLQGEGLRPA